MTVNNGVPLQFYLLENLVKVPKDIAERPLTRRLTLLEKVLPYPCGSHAGGNGRSAWFSRPFSKP
jgi:hypothetical protein